MKITIAENLMIPVFFAALFVSLAAAMSAADGSNKTIPLRDNFTLSGVDGKLTTRDSSDNWFFEFDSDISDGKNLLKAGSSIELLPSSALEKMTQYAIRNTKYEMRLWGRVTRYRGKNFIFPTYFLPLSKTNKLRSQTKAHLEQDKKRDMTINEPNDALEIPQEIISRLAGSRAKVADSGHRIADGKRLNTGRHTLYADFILADRAGFIEEHKSTRAQEHKTYDLCSYDLCTTFVLDALGRGIRQTSFVLLSCQALEQAQRQQSADPELIRFKIAGIVTKYKGQNYLLLQRAERVHSHGNFIDY